MTVHGPWNPELQSMVPWSQKKCGGLSILQFSFNLQQTNLLPASLFPLSDSLQIQDCSATKQNRLLADLNSSALSCEQAVQGGTHANQKLSC